MLLFVHPLEGGLDADDPLSPVLGNVLQFIFRTTMMVERMILTGMFEKYPNLRLCLSHGGGLLAFNIWRLDHSYGLRPELKKIVPQKPSAYLKSLYFDTIVHSVSALDYLIKVVGPDRVVIGTDYPMAMGDFDPLTKISEMNLSAEDRELVLGSNAKQALKLYRRRDTASRPIIPKHRRAGRNSHPWRSSLLSATNRSNAQKAPYGAAAGERKAKTNSVEAWISLCRLRKLSSA